MFRHRASRRSDRENRLLAGYLAFFGGFVNSAGFILIGSFTSHVTGSVGRLASDVASGHFDAAAAALTLIAAFFVGAFVVSGSGRAGPTRFTRPVGGVDSIHPGPRLS